MSEKSDCPECFKTTGAIPVKIRMERGKDWFDSSVQRCDNGDCWHIKSGSREDKLVWIRNVYEYKYFGDYELSPEQLSAVWEAYALASKPAA